MKCPKGRREPREINCPRCGSEDRQLIDICIVYDKYYICNKCGHCDFSQSRKLTEEENDKRLSDFMLRSNKNIKDLKGILERMENK